MTMVDKAWIEIGLVEEIPQKGARIVKTPFGCMAVFRTEEDDVFAIEDRCPHEGGPLSNGIVHGRAVTCPLHNWVISLENGEAQGADEGQVATYGVRVENGRILVDATTLAQPVEG